MPLNRTRSVIFINLTKSAMPALVSVAVFAQPVTNQPLQENSVGKIFLTAEQRLLIDKGQTAPTTPNAIGDKSNPNTSISTKTIHGVVRRSDGHSVIWVNGKMQLHAN